MVRALWGELEHHVGVVRAIDDVDAIYPVVIGTLFLARLTELSADRADVLAEEEAVELVLTGHRLRDHGDREEQKYRERDATAARCRTKCHSISYAILRAPARRFTAMNNSPAPVEIAGIPMARAARIVRTPTTQHGVEAIRTPAGTCTAWVGGFAA